MKAAGSQKSRSECFAAVPFRALGDGRLTRADLACLGVIAAHDRFQANGRGCDAGRPRIAYLANVDIATMSHSVGRLESLGYIGSRAHPGDGRKRIYWVIYADDDARFLSGATNPTPGANARNRTPRPNPIGGAAATDFAEIGGAPKRQPVEGTSQFSANIFPEREKTFGEAVNRHASTRAMEGKRSAWRPVGSHVSEIERRLKAGELHPTDAGTSLTALAYQTTERTEKAHIERVLSEIDAMETE